MILNNVILPWTATGLLVTLLLGACAPARPPRLAPGPATAEQPWVLAWLGEFTRPTATVYPTLSDSVRFGSLSGLAPDVASGQWIGAIDDREGTRVAWLTIGFDREQLQVTPNRMMALTAGPGVADRVARESDLEAIAALPDGTFLMGEEGHLRDGEVWQPAILHVTRDGLVTSVTPYPRMFSIKDDPARGLRDNQGFESLALTPGGRVIAGLEQPLKEDGEPTSFDKPGRGRLIEFAQRGGRWRPGAAMALHDFADAPHRGVYARSAVTARTGWSICSRSRETTLVAMERACLLDAAGERSANAVRLFTVELAGREARKRPLLDLSVAGFEALAGARASRKLRGAVVRANAARRHAHAAGGVGRQLPRHAENVVFDIWDHGSDPSLINARGQTLPRTCSRCRAP